MNDRTTNRDISRSRTFLGNVTKYLKLCLVVTPLQCLVARSSCRRKLEHMRLLPEHTVGHDLAKMLDSRGLKLIPGFAKHDLNHLILGYDMTAEDELCMQAYLLGNGHWKLQCFLFASSAILLPCLWSTLWRHYKLGRQSESITHLKLADCLEQNTEQLRRQYAPSFAGLACSDRGRPAVQSPRACWREPAGTVV